MLRWPHGVGNDALGFSAPPMRAAIRAIALPPSCVPRFSLTNGGITLASAAFKLNVYPKDDLYSRQSRVEWIYRLCIRLHLP
jgi:hypothetical protein